MIKISKLFVIVTVQPLTAQSLCRWCLGQSFGSGSTWICIIHFPSWIFKAGSLFAFLKQLDPAPHSEKLRDPDPQKIMQIYSPGLGDCFSKVTPGIQYCDFHLHICLLHWQKADSAESSWALSETLQFTNIATTVHEFNKLIKFWKNKTQIITNLFLNKVE